MNDDDDLPTLSEATALLWIEDLAKRIERLEELSDSIAIPRRLIEGLRDAYVDSEIQAHHPGYLAQQLDTWIEGVIEEAGMMEEVQQKVQSACDRRRIKVIPNGDG